MLIGINNINIKEQRKYIPTSFQCNPIKFYSCKLNCAGNVVEFVEDGIRGTFGHEIDLLDSPQTKLLTELYQRHIEENYKIFMEHVKPSCRKLVQKLLELPSYNEAILPFTIDLKPSELKHLYELASKRDILGDMRIPGITFHYFSQIPEERLKILEPIILSKNDAGMWNYSPSFILQLDERYSDYQISVMSRLADCKVNGMNLRQIASNPNIDHEKTIERAQELNLLFKDKLREIEFLSNRNGENFLSADIQLPHSEDKPDYLNFKRVFSLLDDNVNPTAKKSAMRELDEYINNIYNNFEMKMKIFTASDLETSIKAVKEMVPTAEESEILRTMQKLTQFADYASLPKIAKGISYDLHPAGGINPYFYYFSKEKYLFNVPKTEASTKSSFITRDDIHSKEFNKLLKRASGSDIEWINLEGWSDGINLFSDNNTLTDKTIKILKRAKKLQAINEDYTFNDALRIVLNREIISGMRNYGYDVKTITIDAPATREVILSQMRPAMPTRSLLKSTIESIASYYTHSTTSKKFKNISMKIAQYYQNNLQVYSKQRIVENLKELNDWINKYARINGVKSENIYYVIPNANNSEFQSFELVTKMYCDLFNIPKGKIVKVKTFKDINKYSGSCVFVVLDDIVGSGDSMARFGDYMHCAKDIKNDKHIFFCPITATQKGINYIESIAKRANRKTIDEVITIYANIVQSNNIATQFIISDSNRALNSKVLGNTGHCNASLCHVFPYIGPDNDSVLASYIIKFFVPDSRCLKNKTDLLPVIEENTYYYDIFGTDKNHILTNAKRVYIPKSPNIIIKFIKNLFKKNE